MRRASSIRWPMATSRRWSPKWSTGRAPPAFAWCAPGKGTKYLPEYHHVTPDSVWAHYGLSPDQAKAAGMNSQMFNSFIDGTKSAIEMAAIANACDLAPPSDGLLFPACGVDDLAQVLRPKIAGGVLERMGTVEVVSSLERDGRPVFRDLRWGVYVVIEAPTNYAAACFTQYGLQDRSDRALRRAVQAVPPDRHGAVDVDPERGAARRADRAVARLQRRLRRHRQARAARRRNARRRRRLHRLRQAAAGADVARTRRAADRARASM